MGSSTGHPKMQCSDTSLMGKCIARCKRACMAEIYTNNIKLFETVDTEKTYLVAKGYASASRALATTSTIACQAESMVVA